MSQGSDVRLKFRVVTPRALAVEAEVQEVALPALDGQLGIFPGHRPLIVSLGRGRLTYREAGREEGFNVRGGHAEVGPDSVLVFTELDSDEPEKDSQG